MTHRWLVVVSLSAHLTVAGLLAVSSLWRLERLESDRKALRGAALVQPSFPPAPSGGPAADPKKPDPPRLTPKIRPRTLVQPTLPSEAPPVSPGTGAASTTPGGGDGPPDTTSTCTGDCAPPVASAPVCGDGELAGGEQCDDGNTADGDGCSARCTREPPPVVAPKFLAPSVMQALRVEGDTQIHPDTNTRNQMLRDNANPARMTFQVCIAADGHVTSATPVGAPRYPAWADAVHDAVVSWRYRPFVVGGTAAPACAAVTFQYAMR